MIRQCCGTCKFWGNPNAKWLSTYRRDCHRFPPTKNVNYHDGGTAGVARTEVSEAEWCGEWAERTAAP